MRIEFDPTNRDEATAVRAVLEAMYPATGGIVTSTETRIVDVKAETEDGQSAAFFIDVPADPSAPTVAVNAVGEPWDARIHSSPPKTNADGTWRAKRGVTAEQVAAVRAEREQAAQVPTPNYTVTVSADQNGKVLTHTVKDEGGVPVCEDPDDPKHLVADPIVSAPKPPPAPAPVQEQSAPPAPTPTGSEPSFLDVMKAITAAQKAGKVDTAKVKELCAAIGAGDSTMGLNGVDKGEHRQLFLQVLGLEPEARDAIIAAAQGEPGVDTVRDLLGGA